MIIYDNMSLLRGSTPLRSAPQGTALIDTVSKQHSRMDELVLKNRTLEHTVEKLKNVIATEEARGREAMQKIQKGYVQERTEWQQGCDALQAAHRLAHLKTAVELDKERVAVWSAREASRKERLSVLQRDYQLVMFQIQETDHLDRVAELEDELENLRYDYELEIQVLSRSYDELDSKVAEYVEELDAARQEKAQLEVRLVSVDLTGALLTYVHRAL